MNKKKLKSVGAPAHRCPNKGITLIALIITIIVMLILVAVTINMAVNGGLFENAGKAVGDTKNEINKEQELANGGIEVDGVWYDSINEYISGTPHKWTRTGDTFTCSHCGATYEMGQVVNYTASGKTSTTITATKSGLDKYYAHVSAYPTGAIVDENGNQMVEAQTTNWVVLGIEDTDGNGIYETLLITTETDLWVTDDEENWYGIYFYRAAAYNNGPNEINRVCEELYSNSEYGKARGMTIEDVNNALNYTPHGGEYYDTSDRTWKTTGNLTTILKDIPTWDNIKGNYKTPDGINTEEALGNYELNGYYYYVNDDATGLINDVNDTTTSITEVEKNTIFGFSTDYAYWLASHSVRAGLVIAVFGPGIVGNGGVESCSDSFYSDGTGNYIRRGGLRPVVSLRFKLPEAK